MESARRLVGAVDNGDFAATDVEADTAAPSELLAEALLLAGRAGITAEALDAARGAVADAAVRFGSEHPRHAQAEQLLARVLADRGDLTEALAHMDAALATARRAWPECAPQLTAVRLARSEVLLALGSLGEVKAELDAAESCRSRVDAAFPESLGARLLGQQGRLAREQGEYDHAATLLGLALSQLERGASDPHLRAQVLNALGEVEWFRGRYEQSRAWHRRALELSESALGRQHPLAGESLSNLALAEDSLGNLAEAVSLQLSALEVTQAARGDEHLETSARLQDLGNYYLKQEDYPRALDLYERAVDLTRRRSGAGSDETAHVLLNLGLLRMRMGEPGRARDALAQALSSWEARRGPDHPYVAHALDLLAVAALADGDLAAAEAALARSAAIREGASGTRPIDLAWTWAKLGQVEIDRGKRDEARRLADRARALCAKGTDAPQTVVAATLSLLGDLDLALRRVDRACTGYEAALRMYEQLLGSEHPLTARTRARLALGLLRAGRSDRAFREVVSAEATRLKHIRRTLRYLGEGQALSFVARTPESLDVLLSSVTRGESDDLRRRQALEAVVASRALVLDEMAARRRAPSASTELDRRLDATRRRIAHLIYREADQAADGRSAALASAGAELEALERLAAADAAEGRVDSGPDRFETAVLAEHLSEGTALVSYVRFRQMGTRGPGRTTESYLAFVLRSSESGPALVRLGAANRIDAAIALWRARLSDVSGALASPRESERTIRRAGEEVARLLWRPLSDHLRGCRTVLMVPDGPIGLVSFAALPSGSQRYLVEAGPTLHYLSSERDLLRPHPLDAARSLLALGGPDYDAPGGGHAPLPERTRPSSSSMSATPSVPACGGDNVLHFPFLPHAAAEATDVARLWGLARRGESWRLLVGREADEQAVKLAAPSNTVLHLATHGFFATPECAAVRAVTRGDSAGPQTARILSANPLLQSGLALSGANRLAELDAGEDGLLTAAEVAGLDLRAVEWVVLSACGSGVGRVQSGEGVLSLQRAFVIAGARTIVMSLWPVEDEYARHWMRALYEDRLLQAASTSEAVRHAHLEVLARMRRQLGAAPPALWAPFVASGDWR